MIFGPIVLYGLSLDRNEPAFGVKDDSFLEFWVDHWSGWLGAHGGIRQIPARIRS